MVYGELSPGIRKRDSYQMPTSDAQGREWVIEQFAKISPTGTIVDVGPGEGTYAQLLRNLAPDAHWVGVEIWAPYVAKYDLHSLYDEIAICNVLEYKWPENVEVVILGDVVEHLEESDARLLLGNLKSIAQNIIVSLPIIDSHQGEVDGNPYEAHLVQWKFDQMLEVMTPCSAWQGDVLGRYWWKSRP